MKKSIRSDTRLSRSYKPSILVSRCLRGDDCRYDGEIIYSREFAALEDFFRVVPICPEKEVGLLSPRAPLRLIKSKKGWLIYQPASKKFYHNEIKSVSMKHLRKNALSGMILKSKSPSCAVDDCKHFRAKTYEVKSRSPGVLSRLASRHDPHLPAIDEKRLKQGKKLFYFLLRVFTRHHWQKLVQNFNIADLQNFHARYKLLLLGFNREIVDEMGRLVANQSRFSRAKIKNRYHELLMTCIESTTDRARWKNVLLHGFGHISDEVSEKEKESFLKRVEEFYSGEHNFHSLHEWLLKKASEFNNSYLARQKFLRPYPKEINQNTAKYGVTPDPFS